MGGLSGDAPRVRGRRGRGGLVLGLALLRRPDELAELVLAGRKRATAGSLLAYELEKEPLPKVGDLSVVTDWEGRARCVIRTTAVEVVPFDTVTPEFAATEGEGDGSLEYWRRVHWAYFTSELQGTGREPRPDMPVVCERFEVVFGPAG